jgi:lipoprotein-anchoring transpeptidase ErfK/SrfK
VRVTVSIALGLLLIGGGAAFAAYRYDAATSNRIMPGVTIAGIDVSELTRQEAIGEVAGAVEANLDREIEVQAGDETWHVTPQELGATAVVEPLVDRALALSDSFTWPERVFHRLLDREVDETLGLRYRQDGDDLGRFVETVAQAVNVDPIDASVSVEDGELVLERPEVGWELPMQESLRAVRRAVAGETDSVELGLERISPEVGRDDIGKTLVIRLSELKLYLYDGLRLKKTYPVAAGSPSYPTPPGEWEIWDKRENPTWVNPAPDGWGKGLPASIPGGPGSPLGTRALYLDAPGIRIHGTPASYSIGTYASHGCIRMLMEDVEELYELVPIGTQVHIVS